MTGIRRFIAVAASVLAVTLAASACDTSPVAARVGSERIKQTALNAQLKELSSDPTYVAAAQSGGATVTGESPGTWSTAWVANVLSTKVYASAASQYVARRGIQPGGDVLAAARGLGEALSGDVWQSFPASYRDQLAQLYADLAQVAPPPADLATLQGIFERYKADFFTEVCVRQIAVSVTDPSGGVDFPASLAAAQEAANRYNSAHSVSGAGITGGSLTCYSQADLEGQPGAFVQAVKALAPGRAQAPQRTPYGYSVLAVESRQSEGFTPAVQAVLGLAVNNGEAFDAALSHVLSQTSVQINPQYGKWQPAGSGSALPRVVPPTGPADALAAVPPTTSTGG